ncbi:MAG: RluA family pseudouridine synthase [Deltaproteobacteria bacterium]|nr:MAG: RluA family pseudouridine synthase [Deltaproteobacteria bacterium]
MTDNDTFTFTVLESDAGQRLDRFLAEQDTLTLSRSLLKRLIQDQHVTINQKGCKPSQRLQVGDHISILVPPPEEMELEPEDIPLDVLFEDSHLIVVNKPAGMVVHPAPGHSTGTLVHALLHHCHDLSGVGGTLRPGIVHRLDRDTSGVMVAAKHDAAHLGLAALFKHRPEGKLERRYWAVARGTFKEEKGTIETMYGRHPTDRKKYSSKVDGPRHAITHYWVLERYKFATLLELKLETGRTHQIRVHLADRQRSLVGDPVYGARPLSVWPNFLKQFPRHALHAQRLAFVHPVTEEWVDCSVQPPEDMRSLLEQLVALSSSPTDTAE